MPFRAYPYELHENISLLFSKPSYIFVLGGRNPLLINSSLSPANEPGDVKLVLQPWLFKWCKTSQTPATGRLSQRQTTRSCTECSPGRGVHVGTRACGDNSISSWCLSDDKGKPRQLWRILDLWLITQSKPLISSVNPSSLTDPWHARTS